MDQRLTSVIHFTKKEQQIRKTQEYIKLFEELQKNKVSKVTKYKEDILQISLISKKRMNQIRQIKCPVFIEQCEHQIFDLYDVFLDNKPTKCGNCGKTLTKQNAKIEQFYENLIQKINEKAYYCSFIVGQVFHSYSNKIRDNARKIISATENQKILEKIIQNSKIKQKELQEQILTIIDRINSSINHQSGEFQVISVPIVNTQCVINYQKIIIPIYIQGCTHLEAYEFTNLIQLIQDEQSKPQSYRRTTIKCFHPKCQNQIPLTAHTLIDKAFIIISLSNAITKDFAFSTQLSFNFQKNECCRKNQKVWDFFQTNETNLKNIGYDDNDFNSNILILFNNFINKEISEKLYLKLRFSSYQIDLRGIKYPARCIKCPLNQCFELTTILIQYCLRNQKQHTQFICPICKNTFDKNQKLEDIVYFDSILNYEIQTYSKYQINYEYNADKQQFIKYFCQNQEIDWKITQEIYKEDQIFPYPNINCSITNKQIDLPVVLPLCKNKRCFELWEFEKILINSDFDFSKLKNCPCDYCQSNQLSLKDFYFDKSLKAYISLYKDDQTLQLNKNSIIADLQDKKNSFSGKIKIVACQNMSQSLILSQDLSSNQSNSTNSSQINHSASMQNIQYSNQFNIQQQNAQHHNQFNQYQQFQQQQNQQQQYMQNQVYFQQQYPNQQYQQQQQLQQTNNNLTNSQIFVNYNGRMITQEHYDSIIRSQQQQSYIN